MSSKCSSHGLWHSSSRPGVPLPVALDGVHVPLVSLEVEKPTQRLKPLLALGDLCPGSTGICVKRINFGPRWFRHYLIVLTNLAN